MQAETESNVLKTGDKIVLNSGETGEVLNTYDGGKTVEVCLDNEVDPDVPIYGYVQSEEIDEVKPKTES